MAPPLQSFRSNPHLTGSRQTLVSPSGAPLIREKKAGKSLQSTQAPLFAGVSILTRPEKTCPFLHFTTVKYH